MKPMFSGNRIEQHTAYKIVSSQDQEEFELICMKFLEDDWIPVGGVQYDSYKGYMQAFQRPEFHQFQFLGESESF